MTSVGAAPSPPFFQAYTPSVPPKPAKQDNDGDERTESAAAKVAEASPFKVNVQA